MCLPFDPDHKEMQTALNLGAVDEAVDVKSVYSLPVWTSCPMTSWAATDKKQKKTPQNVNMESTVRDGEHTRPSGPTEACFLFIGSLIILLLLRFSQMPYLYQVTSYPSLK